jgi:hypothetical protein
MKKTTNKEITSNDNLEVNKQLLKQERQTLQQALIELAESKIQNKFSDKNLDRESLKRKLLSGEITLKQAGSVISYHLKKHPSQFMVEFYAETYRLLGITDKDPAKFFKPKIIADITNETIYGRFDNEVLQTLQQVNFYTGYCIRANKHYQFLNDEGILQLQEFIQQSISLMKSCANYYEFRKAMNREYGISYQTRLFED